LTGNIYDHSISSSRKNPFDQHDDKKKDDKIDEQAKKGKAIHMAAVITAKRMEHMPNHHAEAK